MLSFFFLLLTPSLSLHCWFIVWFCFPDTAGFFSLLFFSMLLWFWHAEILLHICKLLFLLLTLVPALYFPFPGLHLPGLFLWPLVLLCHEPWPCTYPLLFFSPLLLLSVLAQAGVVDKKKLQPKGSCWWTVVIRTCLRDSVLCVL